MIRIKRALISVSDKTGILDLARELVKYKVEILSTGGTARLFRENGVAVKEVSEYTGFPEMLDGRVKTLHPKIHGGLLALRDKPEHMQSLKEQGIGLIDMVVVNLYPFEQTINKPNVTLEEAIENIDIGGPSMLRSAAKNYRSIAVVSNPVRYNQIIEELNKNNGSLPEGLLRDLGVEVFRITSHYDKVINNYLRSYFHPESAQKFPGELQLNFVKLQDLRYGENPHQRGAFYRDAKEVKGLSSMKQLWGKELSFNNILDMNAAVHLVREFEGPAVAFIKHNNPCGVAENKFIVKAYKDAWGCDTLSAFGGIVSVNRRIEIDIAKLILKSGFLECIICPEFSPEALAVLKDKKNLRLLECPGMLKISRGMDFKKIDGGLLLQDEDCRTLNEAMLKVVTKVKPTKKQMESLIFAWKVAKHVKSNAIILTQGLKTVGIGAGQMSRVDSVSMSTQKAGKFTKGSVLASDAFFPKEDALVLAAKLGIKAIIQPGGSISDEQIIKMADTYKIAMIFTGMRHFRH